MDHVETIEYIIIENPLLPVGLLLDNLIISENLGVKHVLDLSIITYDILIVSENFKDAQTDLKVSVFDQITITDLKITENFVFSPEIPGKNVGTLLRSV